MSKAKERDMIDRPHGRLEIGRALFAIGVTLIVFGATYVAIRYFVW